MNGDVFESREREGEREIEREVRGRERGSLKRFNFDAKSLAKFGSKHPLVERVQTRPPSPRTDITFCENYFIFFCFYYVAADLLRLAKEQPYD